MIEVDAAKCAELLKGVDTIILDCDGVLWRGAKAIPGASTAVSHLRALGKRLFFLTNNSTKDRQSLVEKFRALGFTAHLGELIGSSYLLAVFLDGHPALSNPSTAVYVVGREGIIKELGHVGISTLGGPEDDGKQYNFSNPESTAGDGPRVKAVVVGFDEHFNYYKLAKAQHYLLNPACLFLATNTDHTYPDSDRTLPGTGCFVAALEACTGRAATIIGKPSRLAFEALQKAHPGIRAERTLMIGDKMQTDIVFGKQCNMRTILVESGVHKRDDLAAVPPYEHPDLVISSLGCLTDL